VRPGDDAGPAQSLAPSPGPPILVRRATDRPASDGRLTVLRRILSIALVAVGLVVIALAIASATVWRESETVTAALPADPGQPLLVTAPGVLELLDDQVTVTASAPDGAPVVLAVGRESDVTAWVGDAAHLSVTGLSSWTELETSEVEGAAEVPSPAGSDLWVAEATGEGEASLAWGPQDGRYALLAATDGTAPAPRVELTWNRDVSTPFLVPGLVIGALLLIAGAVLAYLTSRSRPTPAAAGGQGPGDASVAPGTPAGGTRTEEERR
jgi:hypothetical protein